MKSHHFQSLNLAEAYLSIKEYLIEQDVIEERELEEIVMSGVGSGIITPGCIVLKKRRGADPILISQRNRELLFLLIKIKEIEQKHLTWLQDNYLYFKRKNHRLDREDKIERVERKENEERVKEASETYKKMTLFTKAYINGFLKDIQNMKEKAELTGESRKYLSLLNHVYQCTLGMQERMQEVRSDFDIYRIQNPLYDYADRLGASFYPSKQENDVLMGKSIDDEKKIIGSRGVCGGLVTNWARHIEAKSSIFPVMPSQSTNVYQSQRKQMAEQVLHTRCFRQLGIQQNTPETVEQLFQHIQPNKIYCLGIRRTSPQAGHAIGIRQIPSTGQIEIFESNLGYFLFGEKLLDFSTDTLSVSQQTAKNWLSFLIGLVYPTYENMALYEVGNQPLDAKPSFDGFVNAMQSERIDEMGENYVNHFFETQVDFVEFKKMDQRYVNIISPVLSDVSPEKLAVLENRLEISSLEIKSAKNRVCQEIEAEVKKSHLSSTHPRTVALRALQEKIQQASPLLTLGVIVNQWREESQLMNGHEKTRREIISMPLNQEEKKASSTSTEQFITTLVKKREVSAHRLCLLHGALFRRLFSIVNQDWSKYVGRGGYKEGQKRRPHTVNDIRNILYDTSSTRENQINAIKQLCEIRPSWCSVLFSGRDLVVNDFYKMISTIEINNPVNISNICDYLTNFESVSFPKTPTEGLSTPTPAMR